MKKIYYIIFLSLGILTYAVLDLGKIDSIKEYKSEPLEIIKSTIKKSLSEKVSITAKKIADTDGDGILDDIDLDDDNDGILDAEESPNCFFTVYEANRVMSVISSLNGAGNDPLAGIDIPLLYNDNNNDGGVATAFNFVGGQTITTGSTIFTIKFPTAIAIKSLNVVQASNGMASAGFAKLYGSNDGTNYTLLTTGNGVSMSNTIVTFNNISNSEFLNYQIRYIGTTAAGNNSSITAGTTAIHEIYSLASSTFVFNPSAHPKIGLCIDDIDNDGIPNHLDSDSDGDGCFDAYEGGATNDKTISVISGPYGANGLANSLENTAESGVTNYNSTYRNYALKFSQKLCIDTDNDGVSNPLDIDDDNDGVLDTDEGDFCGKLDRNIKIGYLNTTVGKAGLATNLLYNLNNFGAYGIYNKIRGVTLVPFPNAASVTEANLISENIDIFYVGSSANNSTSATDKVPTSVNVILSTWSKNNKKGIFALQNNAIDYGYIITDNNTNPNTPVGVLGRDYYTNGYWPTSALNQTGSVQMTIKSITRTFDFLMLDANLRPVLIKDREYDLVIFPDATIYNAEADNATPTTNDQKAIADTWAYIIDKYLDTNCTSLDTDGDGIDNHLDLDSDGDGCSDALESGATNSTSINFKFTSQAGTSTDTNNDGLADIVDVNLNGIPDYLSTYDPQAINNTIKKCIDSDGDEYPDINDLDDDNDGILDTEEGLVCNTLNRNLRIGYLDTTLGKNGLMMNMLSNGLNFSSTGTYNKFPGITFVPYNAQANITETQLLNDKIDIFYVGSSAADAQSNADKFLTATNTRISSWAINNDKGVVVLQNNAIDYGYVLNNAYPNSNPSAPYGPIGEVVFTNGYWPVTTFNMSGVVQMSINSEMKSYNAAMVDRQGKATFIRDRDEKLVFIPDATIFIDNQSVSTIGSNSTLKVAADVWAFAFDTFLEGKCDSVDTDGDGIPNHLDLDSDNDGCFDSIEGDEKITKLQLKTDGSILGAVNNNGVPNLVNTGTSDIGNDIGQGVGTSQNLLIQDVECSDAIGCSSNMYLSQSNILFAISTATNPFTYPTLGTASGNYNAIGLNPLDGKIYGMQNPSSSNLLVINSDGSSINLGSISGLPINVSYNSGEIDNLGNYYVKPPTSNNQLYKVNIGTLTATLIPLSASVNLPDMAFRVIDGLLYGVNVDNGQLVSIDPNSGQVKNIGISYTTSISFGAMFGSSTGEIFGSDNAGGFYQFNLNTGERVLISNSPSSGNNDGAHCVISPITFSGDLSVTKTDNTTTYSPGTTTTYTIVVTNNGPFGVLNAEVKDLVPVGIPIANVSYTAVASSGSTTAVSGVQTGSIDDFVGLPVGGTVTYTVIMNIPFGYNGDLTNTVTVKAPSNITETNLTNNTATDIDLQTVCYKPAATIGVTLDTKHGITSLGRAGADNGNWPMVRKGAWTALEAKTKGFVINRIPTTAALNAIANPVEGMMVYDEEVDCLKIYSSTDGISFSWKCFITPACPD